MFKRDSSATAQSQNDLADVRALFLGGTSSLTLEPDRVRAANTRLQPLIQAEKGYFAETDYNTDDQAKLQADAKRNSNTALTIGAAIEKGGSADERVQVNSSRLVVVSNATFVQDNAITQDQQGARFHFRQCELVAQSRTANRYRAKSFKASHFQS